MAVSIWSVIFVHFFIGSLKRVLLLSFFLLFFVRRSILQYLSSDELEESDKEESDELGSESGLSCTFGTGLGGLLHAVGFYLGVTLSADESCDDD